jgi:hypothetical protein
MLRYASHRSTSAFAAVALIAVACTATKKTTFGNNLSSGAGDDTTTAGPGGNGAGGMSTSATGLDLSAANSGGGTSGGCESPPDADGDKDGFTYNDGDCNDCDPNANPNAIEVIGDPKDPKYVPTDENCDKKTDEPPTPCDAALVLNSTNPFDEAKAIGLCTHNAKSEKWMNGKLKWGVTDAKWTSLDGSAPQCQGTYCGFQPFDPAKYALGHGILTGFGPNVKVQEGKKMMALSNGTARQPTDPGYMDVGGFDKGYTMKFPVGNFPKESPSCPNVKSGEPHDGAATVFKIRTPSNAHGFKFNFNFFTFEWPGYVCSTYNDFFVAMLSPIPMGLLDGNIVFDKQKNPVSVNNAFLEVCGCTNGPPCSAGGKSFSCALGSSTLMGNGFGKDLAFGQDHASTMWLETQAPVEPNSDITLEFAEWDSGDGVLDSTTLVDNFQWIAQAGTSVGTAPVQNPK